MRTISTAAVVCLIFGANAKKSDTTSSTATTSTPSTSTGLNIATTANSTGLGFTSVASTAASGTSSGSVATSTPSSTSMDTSAAIAQQFGLNNTWIAPVPNAPLSGAANFLIQNYNATDGRILGGSDDVNFVTDPFDTSNTSPVLSVAYPPGSFSPVNSQVEGGVHFYATPFQGNQYGEMLLHYEVAFDPTFDWVLGGKLPGLFGGDQSAGCSGGTQSDGSNCWSMRLMWRQGGDGEAYAYVPTSSDFCNQNEVMCNYDYGKSIGRHLFTFTPGAWNSVDLFVGLNNPPSSANGRVSVFFNGVEAISLSDVQYRTTGSQSDGLLISSMMFSTFFGGGTTAWASTGNATSYFRNIKLYSPQQANYVVATGSASKASSSPFSLLIILLLAFLLQ